MNLFIEHAPAQAGEVVRADGHAAQAERGGGIVQPGGSWAPAASAAPVTAADLKSPVARRGAYRARTPVGLLAARRHRKELDSTVRGRRGRTRRRCARDRRGRAGPAAAPGIVRLRLHADLHPSGGDARGGRTDARRARATRPGAPGHAHARVGRRRGRHPGVVAGSRRTAAQARCRCSRPVRGAVPRAAAGHAARREGFLRELEYNGRMR